MYEFCINYARTLWNFDTDLFGLPIYASICWSASTSTSTYLFFCVFWCLPFLSLAVEPSAAKRSEAALNYIVFQSVAKQCEAALNYMLESVRKFMDIVIRAPQHIIN